MAAPVPDAESVPADDDLLGLMRPGTVTVVSSDNHSGANWLDGESTGPLEVLARHEQVARRIAHGIRVGRFRPGDRLPSERVLAEQLGVGRASVREAIALLQLQQVVETRHGAGSFVVDDAHSRLLAIAAPGASDTSPSALLEARLLLEPAVAAAAAQRALGADPVAEELLLRMERTDDETNPAHRRVWDDADRLFHRQITVMTGNEVLLGIADLIAVTMDEPLWKQLRDDSIAVPGRMRLHVAEHRLIYESVARGDADAAAFYVREHLMRVRRNMALD